ncbi:HlyD family secretion protein [Desulfosporosinus sp. SYSU MS00001]|uniref:HlyD family secretion protein n=1 Tax=Desulfosporosinus sp. SYSU MS00001 TaxID=3416284 RepID=UPI003CF2CB23
MLTVKRLLKSSLIAGSIGILLFSLSGCGKKAETTGQNAAKPVTKQVVEAFGVVKSSEVETINLDIPAVVTKVNVAEGQTVNRGETLIRLDTENYQDQIRSKQLELRNLQLELADIEENYEAKRSSLDNSSDPNIKKYINERKYAEELYTSAVKELTAREELYKAGAFSLEELNHFRDTVNEKKKAVEDAVYSEESSRKEIQDELADLITSRDEKNNNAASLEFDIQTMQEKMNKSYLKGNDIIADVTSGVVGEIGCAQGDIISTEQGKKLLTILNKDSLYVEADVAEEFIKDVKIGAEVAINPQADKSRTYKGKVLTIAEKAVQKDNETIIPVRIAIEKKDSFLLPEFNVDVSISAENKKQD